MVDQLHVLGTRFSDALRRARVRIAVNNQPVVGAFNRGCANDLGTSALLAQPVDLPSSNTRYSWDILLLRWVPSAENGVPGTYCQAIQLLECVCLKPGTFGDV